jgi:hypothetical protein
MISTLLNISIVDFLLGVATVLLVAVGIYFIKFGIQKLKTNN